jgi:hypothetical protein
MANLPWFEEVRERLLRRGLPPTYVQRFVAELADHFHDLKEETMGAEADLVSRLGEPAQVADAAVAAYRRRSFIGRHPAAAFLVFAISPVITQWVLMIFGVVALRSCSGQGTFDWYDNHWGLSLLIAVSSIFLGILYGELAMRLGLGSKWRVASCVVLGVIAMFWESAFGRYAGTDIVMLPVQFAVPLGVGWWVTKRKCNPRYAAMKFFVLAILPVASYTLLSFVVPLAISIPYSVAAHSGPATAAAWSYVSVVLMFVIPTVVASILCYQLAKEYRSGKKWMLVSGMVLAMLAAMPFMPLLLLYLVPTVAASVLYCKLAMHFDIGRKWMLVSCTLLAVWAAMHYLQSLPWASYDGPGQWLLQIGMTCIGLAQFLAPLAIGWWFMRREHAQGPLQLAS